MVLKLLTMGRFSLTDEEVLKMYEDMLEYFGELPNPEQEPRRFAHYVKVYKYYNARNEEATE
jgi:hypothetical protein